ncbi:MAG: hypothetical protein JKY49_00410 [Cohaesibacteraceae bacterium]|nr:hypothetical protein [Cohaesibacteraceae bacterium]MBL4875760.1 hypothetical protein [Cohaesibacteraceae bacterium]
MTKFKFDHMYDFHGSFRVTSKLPNAGGIVLGKLRSSLMDHVTNMSIDELREACDWSGICNVEVDTEP